MLVYKDGRFYAGRSSFALVNGYKLNDAPPALYRNGINLYTSDEACMIDVNFEHGIGRQTEKEGNYCSSPCD